MSTTTQNTLPVGTTAPYAAMHKWLQRGLFVCLTVLVFEGAFSLPLILVWMGWPTLTPVEVCSEMMKVRYSRSEEHTSELQSLMRISYAVFCLKKKKHKE